MSKKFESEIEPKNEKKIPFYFPGKRKTVRATSIEEAKEIIKGRKKAKNSKS